MVPGQAAELSPGSCWLPRRRGHSHGTACSSEIYLPPHVASDAQGPVQPLRAFGYPSITPGPQGLPYSPKTLQIPQGWGGGAQHALWQEGNTFSCAGGKIAARSSPCQLGRIPESTQVPLQPFVGELTRCLGRCPAAGAAGDLGTEREHPGCAESKVRARKALCMDFSQGAFPGRLSSFLC